MAEKEELQKKLDEFDTSANWETARKLDKAKLVARQLKKLEERKDPPLSDPNPPSDDEHEDDEPGVPEGLRFKRSYTVTEKAIAARKKNAQKSTGPKAPTEARHL